MAKKQPVKKQTPSITDEQLAELRDIMPQAFTEGKIDFDKLRASLGDFAEERPERYSFTWAGKRDAIRILQTPSRATLTPARKESVEFNKTQNIFIEGDNLEVLKLLYKPYFGQVKMIYIDPPYNTGNDFVYPDNFADPLDTYLKMTGQKDSEGNLLTSNAETSGRYHSAWLSMMYPRLLLARQLLQDDGVIFISIDDNEVTNLRRVCDEIFGESNFISQIIWKKRSTPPNDQIIGAQHEYIVVYGKSEEPSIFLRQRNSEQIGRYKNLDDHPKGPWVPGDLMANVKGGRYVASLYFPITNPRTGQQHFPGKDGNWRFNKQKIEQLIKNNEIYFGEDGKSRPKLKRFLSDVKEGITWTTIWDFVPLNTDGSKEMVDIFGSATTFENPKPSGLIKYIVKLASKGEDIVLDFFAGSCTVAQAVLELNREDGGDRKFILVQLPEPTENKQFPTIAEIGKERIRRVIKKMKKEREGQLKLDKAEDLGFKVFKLAESNYKQWDSAEQKDSKAYAKQMELLADPLVKDWKEEDVLYEVALKEGYGLNVQMEETESKGIQKVTDPDKGQSFYLCLADKIKLKDLKSLNLRKDDLFICRDVALDDESAANLALQCRLKTI
jgi:adenine-specific DNA-methyltransferase